MAHHNQTSKKAPPTLEDYSNRGIPDNKLEFGLSTAGNASKKSQEGLPLVSVVTIVYNAATTLERTIESVLSQTYPNIEYIIIDGGSSDGSLDVIRKHQDHIDYCLSEADYGIADAFNKGIALSHGEIIGLINADDWYATHTVRTVVDHYRQHGRGIYHGNIEKIHPGLNISYKIKGTGKNLERKYDVRHPTVFVSRDVYRDAGLFRLDFEIAMDYDWFLRAKTLGVPYYYIDAIMTHVYRGGKSDRKWWKLHTEMIRARSLNIPNINPISNYARSIKEFSLHGIRKLLERLRLTFIVKLYSKYISKELV